jgi:hypothetical protein
MQKSLFQTLCEAEEERFFRMQRFFVIGYNKFGNGFFQYNEYRSFLVPLQLDRLIWLFCYSKLFKCILK